MKGKWRDPDWLEGWFWIVWLSGPLTVAMIWLICSSVWNWIRE